MKFDDLMTCEAFTINEDYSFAEEGCIRYDMVDGYKVYAIDPDPESIDRLPIICIYLYESSNDVELTDVNGDSWVFHRDDDFTLRIYKHIGDF